jgi:3-hydroxybutyryl-CoA dehydrogenase
VRTTLCARDLPTLRRRLEAAVPVAVASGRRVPDGLIDEVALVSDPGKAREYAVVAESLPEDLDLKVELLRLATAGSPDAVVLSNTSSLRIAAIASRAGLEGRVVGAHYWNPPLLMPLVELVAPEGTEELAQWAASLLCALGKRPVRVKDVPGFAWNRLQFSLLREAAALTRDGIISARDLDVVVREGLAPRWSLVGPFESMVLGGVGTFERIADNLYPVLATDQAAGDLAVNGYLEGQELAAREEARDEALARRLRMLST